MTFFALLTEREFALAMHVEAATQAVDWSLKASTCERSSLNSRKMYRAFARNSADSARYWLDSWKTARSHEIQRKARQFKL